MCVGLLLLKFATVKREDGEEDIREVREWMLARVGASN